ncbi:MAG: ribosome silencing factor [Flavobacteriales bacterium]|jgi:ribosome-associated protein|nr:ribosome silencing factor [Flavobacteriales bacterium]MDG1916913.1 ribosome silencing factor [Flavobacteriales bacterium]|tara:strand:+ start:8026 stop:8403 length:378 start_codon:yes stop_codon:yes gene_type:complete
MSIKKELKTSDILANVIIEGMREIKAKEIVSLDLRGLESSVCDFFIVCHGTSNTHASAIADSVIEETLKTVKEKPWHKEGLTNGDWILLDYGNVVAHIFQKEIREYYNIEKLWGDAKIQLIKETA